MIELPPPPLAPPSPPLGQPIPSKSLAPLPPIPTQPKPEENFHPFPSSPARQNRKGGGLKLLSWEGGGRKLFLRQELSIRLPHLTTSPLLPSLLALLLLLKRIQCQEKKLSGGNEEEE